MVKEMVAILFPATKNIDEVVGIIEKYRMKFGLDTGLRLAHFLAQVREETGSEFKVVRENLNYTVEALPKLFSAFRGNELAQKYGRSGTQKANQEMIANIAYANKLGNGNVDSGDGWKYRGAGCLQITGKDNFAEVQKRCVKYAGKEMDPDTLEGFIVFGFGFWMWQDLYKIADGGRWAIVVDNITKKINLHTDSYAERRKHFDSIKHLVK